MIEKIKNEKNSEVKNMKNAENNFRLKNEEKIPKIVRRSKNE